MHLPYLRELADRFEIAALCDLSPGTLAAVGDRFGVGRRFTDWCELLAEDLHAVLVLTSGSHAAPAIEAARRGLHLFVEKPMSLTLGEADAMIAAARSAGVTLMIGYMKRYDPAYEYARERIRALRQPRLARVTTLEAAYQHYVGIYPLVGVADLPGELTARLAAEELALAREALGDGAPEEMVRLYPDTLLGSMIHELDLVRDLLGDPLEVLFAETWREPEAAARASVERWGGSRASLHTVLAYPEGLRLAFSWAWLPDLPDYRQELAFYASDARVTIRFPSPYLRNAPTEVELEQAAGGAVSRERVVASYEEAFKRELIHFHERVTTGRPPRTPGEEARGDIALALAVARAAIAGRPQRVAAER